MSSRDDEASTRHDGGHEPAPDPAPPIVYPPRISRFTVLRPLGAGGMGVVYSAYDDELGRKVAIKVLHASRSHETRGRARMLREAQALARLAHPNVVRIYEVGEFDHQLYLAMEFLQGDTLRAWQTARPRAWREVLAVYLQAGRGLAAAHAAGIVHRDFKPDNVIVGDDGFIRVLDFGVARADESTEPTPTEPGRSEDSFEEALTLAGSLIGTPAYMSLEQLRGRPANAQSDQFSFCVALHEGLYGVRPFRGSHLADLRRSVALGQIEDPPRGARVPPWLRRAILRGLDNDPSRRWPSMQALLAALERDPGRRVRQWAATAALVAVASGATFAATRGPDPAAALCKDAAARLAGVWDDARRETLRQSLRATGLAYAPAVADHVVEQLDAYAAQWTHAYTEACEATAIRGVQSEALLDLRMTCLHQRRAEVRALVDLLHTADTRVDRAVQAAADLRSLATCNDGAALAARLPPPESEDDAEDVAAVREQLAAARAHQIVGSHDEGLKLTAEALRRARALDYRPLVAEALQRTGELQHNSSAFAAAEATLLEAYFAAEALRHDEVELAAAVRLAYLVGVHQARHDEGLLWSRHAQALIDRGGAAIDEQIVLLHSVGMIRAQQGNSQEARALLERSLTLTREHMGQDAPQAATILIDLGNLDNDRGDHERAQPRYEEAYAVIEATLGPDHPLAIKALNNLGNALRGQGRFAPARAHIARALALADRVLPPGHPSTAIVLSSLGEVLADEDRLDEAASTLSRSLDALVTAFGPDHPYVAAVSTSLGDVHRRLGDLTAAHADLERALAVAEKFGADHPDLAAPLTARGELLLVEGDLEAASAAFTRALAVIEKTSGPTHRHALTPLVGLGEAALAAGRPAEALAPLERALALTTLPGVTPALIARTQFGLARARWATTSSRPRSRPSRRWSSFRSRSRPRRRRRTRARFRTTAQRGHHDAAPAVRHAPDTGPHSRLRPLNSPAHRPTNHSSPFTPPGNSPRPLAGFPSPGSNAGMTSPHTYPLLCAATLLCLGACGDDTATSDSRGTTTTLTTFPTTDPPTSTNPPTSDGTADTGGTATGTATGTGDTLTSTTSPTSTTAPTTAESGESGPATVAESGETTQGVLSTGSTGPGDPVCGDGLLAPGEECDDGNDNPVDTCSNTCTKVPCEEQEGNPQELLSFIWIANSSQGTVSKIDTKTGVEHGRYYVQGGQPSRTSVNLLGDVAVSSRDPGGVTKIAARLESCIDKNANGMIETSNGPNNILPFGTDECVLWTKSIPSTGYGFGPRATAWEGTKPDPDTCQYPPPRLWFGWMDAQMTAHFERVDGTTGATLDTVMYPWASGSYSPYGGAVNAAGDFFATGLSTGPVIKIDAQTLQLTDFGIPQNGCKYGMTLDLFGNIWVGGCNDSSVYHYDVANNVWSNIGNAGGSRVNGIMADKDGNVWGAGSSGCRLVHIDAASKTYVNNNIPLPGCSAPWGVSIDIDGYVWVVDMNGQAYKVHPVSYQTEITVTGLVGPYTYSDMTGAALNAQVNPQ